MPLNKNTKLAKILEKEVSRRQFIFSIGGALVGIMGLSSLIGLLSPEANTTKPSKGPGYGKQGYGP